MKLRVSLLSLALGHDLQLTTQYDRNDGERWYIVARDGAGVQLGDPLAWGDFPISDAAVGAARARAIMLYPERITEPTDDAVDRLVEAVKAGQVERPVLPHFYVRDRNNSDDAWACKHCPLGAHDPIHTVPTAVNR